MNKELILAILRATELTPDQKADMIMAMIPKPVVQYPYWNAPTGTQYNPYPPYSPYWYTATTGGAVGFSGLLNNVTQ